MTITEKVSYLKGLAEGMKVEEKGKEGKLISVIIDVLEDIALEMQDIEDEQCDLEEGLDAVSDDLADLESLVYESLDEEQDDEDDEEADEEEECYATTCPNCEEEVFFDESVLEDGYVTCPNCGEKLEFDAEDVEDCRSCEGCPAAEQDAQDEN